MVVKRSGYSRPCLFGTVVLAGLVFGSCGGGTMINTAPAADSPTHFIELSWSQSESAVSGYNIYRGSHTGGPYSKINSSLNAAPAYRDTSVRAGQTYFYVTTSVDSSGVESLRSNEAISTVPTP